MLTLVSALAAAGPNHNPVNGSDRRKDGIFCKIIIIIIVIVVVIIHKTQNTEKLYKIHETEKNENKEP